MTIPTRRIALLLAALALSACATRNELPAAANIGDDDEFCRANNVAVGSTDYVNCRKNRDVQRSNAITRANRAQRNLGEFMMDHPDRP